MRTTLVALPKAKNIKEMPSDPRRRSPLSPTRTAIISGPLAVVASTNPTLIPVSSDDHHGSSSGGGGGASTPFALQSPAPFLASSSYAESWHRGPSASTTTPSMVLAPPPRLSSASPRPAPMSPMSPMMPMSPVSSSSAAPGGGGAGSTEPKKKRWSLFKLLASPGPTASSSSGDANAPMSPMSPMSSSSPSAILARPTISAPVLVVPLEPPGSLATAPPALRSRMASAPAALDSASVAEDSTTASELVSEGSLLARRRTMHATRTPPVAAATADLPRPTTMRSLPFAEPADPTVSLATAQYDVRRARAVSMSSVPQTPLTPVWTGALLTPSAPASSAALAPADNGQSPPSASMLDRAYDVLRRASRSRSRARRDSQDSAPDVDQKSSAPRSQSRPRSGDVESSAFATTTKSPSSSRSAARRSWTGLFGSQNGNGTNGAAGRSRSGSRDRKKASRRVSAPPRVSRSTANRVKRTEAEFDAFFSSGVTVLVSQIALQPRIVTYRLANGQHVRPLPSTDPAARPWSHPLSMFQVVPPPSAPKPLGPWRSRMRSNSANRARSLSRGRESTSLGRQSHSVSPTGSACTATLPFNNNNAAMTAMATPSNSGNGGNTNTTPSSNNGSNNGSRPRRLEAPFRVGADAPAIPALPASAQQRRGTAGSFRIPTPPPAATRVAAATMTTIASTPPLSSTTLSSSVPSPHIASQPPSSTSSASSSSSIGSSELPGWMRRYYGLPRATSRHVVKLSHAVDAPRGRSQEPQLSRSRSLQRTLPPTPLDPSTTTTSSGVVPAPLSPPLNATYDNYEIPVRLAGTTPLGSEVRVPIGFPNDRPATAFAILEWLDDEQAVVGAVAQAMAYEQESQELVDEFESMLAATAQFQVAATAEWVQVKTKYGPAEADYTFGVRLAEFDARWSVRSAPFEADAQVMRVQQQRRRRSLSGSSGSDDPYHRTHHHARARSPPPPSTRGASDVPPMPPIPRLGTPRSSLHGPSRTGTPLAIVSTAADNEQPSNSGIDSILSRHPSLMALFAPLNSRNGSHKSVSSSPLAASSVASSILGTGIVTADPSAEESTGDIETGDDDRPVSRGEALLTLRTLLADPAARDSRDVVVAVARDVVAAFPWSPTSRARALVAVVPPAPVEESVPRRRVLHHQQHQQLRRRDPLPAASTVTLDLIDMYASSYSSSASVPSTDDDDSGSSARAVATAAEPLLSPRTASRAAARRRDDGEEEPVLKRRSGVVERALRGEMANRGGIDSVVVGDTELVALVEQIDAIMAAEALYNGGFV
ncbi:hypothetical protein BC828DRAFT_380022 [Blastocladiella britannica]|nr:hypothetical protein BC828DRAFT_380022 [Blastocladiella britannica]